MGTLSSATRLAISSSVPCQSNRGAPRRVRQCDPSHRKSSEAERDRQQENGAPAERIDHRAAERRSYRGRQHDAEAVQAHRAATLVCGNTRNSATIASGCNTPAAAPCRTRAAISASALHADGAQRGRAEEQRERRDERPSLAPRLDAPRGRKHRGRGRGEGTRSTLHCTVSWPTCSSCIIAGNATLTIVAARIVETVPIITVATTRTRLAMPGGAHVSVAANCPPVNPTRRAAAPDGRTG